MKKIGIVGGLAWPSTVDYYTELCRRSEERQVAASRTRIPTLPEMAIESLDFARAASLIGIDGDEASWSGFDEYHRDALRRLEAGGAAFALIACNTAHHRFEEIVRGVGIPVIHIWQEAARECARLGAAEVLILGTGVTMRSARLSTRFADDGVEAAGPEDDAARTRTAGVISDLQAGRTEGAAERIERIAKESFAKQFNSPPFVCLACTELALAFPEQKRLASFSAGGVTYINSAAAHVAAAIELAAAD